MTWVGIIRKLQVAFGSRDVRYYNPGVTQRQTNSIQISVKKLAKVKALVFSPVSCIFLPCHCSCLICGTDKAFPSRAHVLFPSTYKGSYDPFFIQSNRKWTQPYNRLLHDLFRNKSSRKWSMTCFFSISGMQSNVSIFHDSKGRDPFLHLN